MTTDSEKYSHPIDSEQKKNLIDLFKHQMTLCTASIIFTMAIVGNFLPQPLSDAMKIFIGLSLLFFLFSLVLAFSSLVDLITVIENYRKWNFWMYMSFCCFVLGILVIGLIILFG
tara:strand:+ start:1048 stop:1392 length:345 start_codon:yes stop_codon:yes gene_type:complete